MPGNTIKINKRADLEWYVGDSKMDDLIEWLDKNGEKCEVCESKVCESKVIDFEDAVEAKSKHQLLDMWMAELVFPGKVEDFIEDIAGHGTGDGEVYFKVCFYTDEHLYNIIAIDREGDEGYLGCQVSTRKARPGENWMRGNDLPDGPFNKKTWNSIITGIVRYELTKLSIYKKPDTIPEDIA